MVTADNRNLDQPRDPIRGVWNDSPHWAECLRIGHLMADEAQRIVKAPPPSKPTRVICLKRSITIVFRSESPELLWAVVMLSPLTTIRAATTSR